MLPSVYKYSKFVASLADKMGISFRDSYFHYRKAAPRADSLARHAGLEAVSGQIPELFMRLYDQIRKLRVNRCQKSAVTTRALFSRRYAFALVGIFTAREHTYSREPTSLETKLRNALYLRIRIFMQSYYVNYITDFCACHWSIWCFEDCKEFITGGNK